MVADKSTPEISNLPDSAQSVLRYLLDEKPSSAESLNPLELCAETGKYNHAVLLLDAGASIDTRNAPAGISAQHNRHQMLELFLARGARTDIADVDSETRLHLAAAFGDLRILGIFRRARLCGIDTESKNLHGFTAMERWSNERRILVEEDDATYQKSGEVFQELLKGIGTDPK